MLVELLPRHRQLKIQRRRCIRRWLFGTSAWLGAWIVVLIGSGVRVLSSGQVTADLERLERETIVVRAHESKLRRELTLALSTLQASEIVANQVDWRELIKVGAVARGSDIVLRDLDLSTGGAPLVEDPNRRRSFDTLTSGAVHLIVSGFGRGQPAVSDFVLRLEATSLFQRVRLVESRREIIADGEVIAFRLECVFGEDGGES